jgi:hypothetical protein
MNPNPMTVVCHPDRVSFSMKQLALHAMSIPERFSKKKHLKFDYKHRLVLHGNTRRQLSYVSITIINNGKEVFRPDPDENGQQPFFPKEDSYVSDGTRWFRNRKSAYYYSFLSALIFAESGAYLQRVFIPKFLGDSSFVVLFDMDDQSCNSKSQRLPVLTLCRLSQMHVGLCVVDSFGLVVGQGLKIRTK